MVSEFLELEASLAVDAILLAAAEPLAWPPAFAASAEPLALGVALLLEGGVGLEEEAAVATLAVLLGAEAGAGLATRRLLPSFSSSFLGEAGFLALEAELGLATTAKSRTEKKPTEQTARTAREMFFY